MTGVHGQMTLIKWDLQRLGPLEVKVESMLQKFSLLEKMEQMLQKWENPAKASPSEERKDMCFKPKGPIFGLVNATAVESSIRAKSSSGKEPREDLKRTGGLRPVTMSETDVRMKSEGGRIEALTRHLEMPTFDGWNPEGWDFRVERFFLVHMMTEEERLVATTISLDVEALASF